MEVVELVRGASPRGRSAAGADEARTRTRVRTAVAELGPVTAARVAEVLGLTGPAVRRHLDAMLAEGVLDAREPRPEQRRGRGRPAKEFVVASAGHDALPAGYDDMALSALAYLAEVAGPGAVEDFASRRFAALEESMRQRAGDLAGAGTAERVDALAAALAEQGFSASARPVAQGTAAEGTQLCQGHCPVQRVAQAFPQLCEAERRAFERILGSRVQRLATLAHGDHVCTTFVPHEGPAQGPAPGSGRGPGRTHPHDRAAGSPADQQTPTEGRRP
ncbi:transcriptional regulator [Kineococcus sp. T13]|nr:transcriptional regulator [Kineococcus vitellinus]NAZ76467.1 transcriptional regulator [Kineococcus vitellinus]